MTIGLVGPETVTEMVRGQLATRDLRTATVDLDDLPDLDALVVAGTSGTDVFTRANREAIDASIPLLTIERGGLGGHAVETVQVAVGLFSPQGSCYRCLQTRIEAVGPEVSKRSEPEPTLERLAGAIAGHELVQEVTASEDRIQSRIIELPYARRELLPVPGCPICGAEAGPGWERPAGTESRSLPEAVEAAERCLDPRVGLVTEIGELASMPLPYYLATLGDTSAFSDGKAPQQAAGVSEDWNQAFMKGIGEALERYAGGVYRTSELHEATATQLTAAIPPEDWVRPDDKEPVETSIRWAQAEDLNTGEEHWVPADLVYFPPADTYVRPPITTGLALGNTPTEAALNGLAEVIERDAAMLAWYSTYEPLGLRVEDPGYEQLCKRAGVEDLSVEAVLLTQDVDLPVVAVALERADRWPQFAMGSSAGFDAVDAARNALREAIQNWMELDQMGREQAEASSGRIASYATNPSPATAFMEPETRVPAHDVNPNVPDSPEVALERLVAEVADAGMQPLVSWITPRDLQEVGFVAARVAVPSAQPLLSGQTYFGERSTTVPEAMGFAPRLSRAPHPFP